MSVSPEPAEPPSSYHVGKSSQVDAPAVITVDKVQKENPPPSYESLFGRIKKARDESKGKVDFAKKCDSIWTKTLAYKVLWITTFLIGIANIVIGAVYVHECPKREFVPQYLMMDGSGIVILCLIKAWKWRIEGKDKKDGCQKKGGCLDTLEWMFFVYLVIIFFVAHSALFGEVEDKKKGFSCSYVVYWYTFVRLILTWSIIAFVIIGVIVVGCIAKKKT